MASAPTDEIRSWLGSSIRQMLGGQTEPRHLEPPTDGLFGPDSGMWTVHGDASMLVGGIRALIIQTLHPPTMAGVADHSDYRNDPLGRLQRTGQFVGVTSFGGRAEVEQAIAALDRIHQRVEGVTPDGEPYRATDPHLLAWVHATEVDSFLRARQVFGADRISDATSDRYVADMAVIADMMGIIDPPTDQASLKATLESYRPELKINHQSREALRFLVMPPLPLPARAPYGVLLGGAVSTLPRWAKRKLWLPPMPVTERLAVRPATLAMTRILGWALGQPPGTTA